uniref:Phospholipid-transporting ATPase n=1 Tax=Phytophthora ramorum TaxID=164328 RepID=H3HAP9_PHYRM
MRIQAEAAAAAEDPGQRLRVIRVDRKTLLARANAAQRRRRREEREARRLGNRRRSSWLFGGTKRPHEDTVEPPSPFTSNVVVSAKYSAWNFAPRVLLAQLQRPSNVYFLFIAVLQTIREVSNTNGIPTILLPLAVVFVCSAIKEALEDRERHRADRVANSRPVLTLTPLGSWEQRQWGELSVGDIVKVMNDQTVPADLFLLSAEAVQHEEDVDKQQQDHVTTDNPRQVQAIVVPQQETVEANLAYIETKSLDGETNLKIRTAIPLVAALCRDSGSNHRTIDGGGHNALRGIMVCEQPNNRITSFEGTFSAMLSPTQADTLGVAVCDSRNTNQPSQPAAGVLQAETTGEGLVRVCMPVTAKQMMLRSCVLRNTRSVTGMVIFTGHETKVFCSNTEPVVKTSSVERRLNRLIIGIVFIQQLICFLGALLGAHWMHTEGDYFWYLLSAAERKHHNLTDAPSSHPLAELAKLHLRYFIIMQNFVPISLNVSLEFVKYWQAYFIEQDLEMYDKQSDTPAMVRSSALNEDLGRVHHVFTDKTGTLTMNLMLFRYFCHTLIPTKSFAEMCTAFCNVRFVHRTPTTMMVMEPGWATPNTYKLLNVLEFDSDRKRMTVIVEAPDGADNVIFERLAADQATLPGGMSSEQAAEQLTLYAKAGMRTLCLAYKTIGRSEYETWSARYTQAHGSMEELVKRRQGRANAIDPLMNEIERDLILLGVTAVQDKLQAGVPATLRLLQETNIKVWTLTGDKMETAVNIGTNGVATDAEYADKFTSDEESLYDITVDAENEAVYTPEYGSLTGSLYGGEGRRQGESTSQKLALVIDGQALEFALRPQLRKLFYQVTRQCASAVICCRVSPKQKAEIVEFVREFEPDSVTLAIGDGANDVAMIQSAHIGVGISGQEGAQAVNASDYALAQFRFLQRLLFVHGRWAYRRVAKLMSYMLYKNVTYVLTTFWFGCFCGFSGQPLILDVAAQSFNVLYTSVPLVLFAVFDQDVSSTSAAKFPYLYALGQKNVLLARRVFWPWIFNGKSGGLVTLGFVVFTNLVIVVNLKLCLETFMLTWQFLLTVTVSILLCLLRDALWKIVRRFSLPSLYHILQERELMGLPNSPRVAGFQSREKKRNIRIRGSFHATGSSDSFGSGVEPSFLETPGSVAATITTNTAAIRSSSFIGVPGGQYHGYAFSEDENVDSDVEAASSRGDTEHSKSSFGAHASIKKVLKTHSDMAVRYAQVENGR